MVKEKLDYEVIQTMKKAGMEKPENVSSPNWNQIESMNKPVYKTIAYLAAMGLNTKEISKTVHMSKAHVKTLIESERMKFEIKTVQYKLFGKDTAKRFQDILPEAIDTAEKVMKDPHSKPSLKFAAAVNFMDRALGKPKQSVEIEGSLVKAIYDKIDGAKVVPTLELEKVPVPLGNPNKAPIKEADEIDSWVLTNFSEN